MINTHCLQCGRRAPHGDVEEKHPMSTSLRSTLPHSSSLRSHRYYGRQGCWIVTKCIEPRRPLLIPDHAQTISEALALYAVQGKATIAAFVVMPDHWHLLFHTSAESDVSEFMRTVCRWISRETGVLLREHGAVWQDGFHESYIRSIKQFQYVHAISKRILSGNIWWRQPVSGNGQQRVRNTRALCQRVGHLSLINEESVAVRSTPPTLDWN